MINAKKKGNLWENRWANWLRDHGIRAWKDGASGGGTREKSDVGNDLDISFQVKAVKKLNLMEAWRQARRDADLVHDTPCVVVHFDNMSDDEFLVVMNNYDWLDLVKGENKAPEYTDPKFKWALSRLKNEITSVNRFL